MKNLRSCIVFLLLQLPLTGLMAQEVQQKLSDSAECSIQMIKDDSLRLSTLLLYAKHLNHIQTSKAIKLKQDIVSEAKKLGYTRLQLLALNSLGDNYLLSADYPESLNAFLEELNVARKSGSDSMQYNALKSISIIYLRNHELPKSISFLKLADSLVRIKRMDSFLSEMNSEMGIRFSEELEIDSSIKRFRIAVELARKYHQVDNEINALVNMAVQFKKKKDYTNALKIYRECLLLAKKRSDFFLSVVVKDNMANLYYEAGDLDMSEHNALEALASSDSLKENKSYVQEDILTLLVKLYEQKGNYASGFQVLKRLGTLKDTIFNEESAQQLQDATVRFETQRKDIQIARQDQELQYRNRLTIFLSVGLALFLLAAGITYFNQIKVRKLNRQVLVQKQELEQLNAMKDRIFSAISHDIRTPLSSLFSFTRLMTEGDIPQEKMTLYTGQLKLQLNYTLGMMDNLLHWARSQMQGFSPQMEAFNLTVIITEIVEAARFEAENKGIQLLKEIPEQIQVYTDRQMISLILRNLVQNAVKYTPRAGSIQVSASETGSIVTLRVSDSGIGIDPEAVAAFNAQEKRMDSTPGTSGEKGTGLGLLLCKSFASLLHGTLILSSPAGKGSTFILSFPGR